jgi:HEAT repeat protein
MTPDVPARIQEPSWDECLDLLRQFPGLDDESRSVAIERLVRSQRPGIRDRALQMGVAAMPDDALVAFLRNDSDAVLRNAALEIFKLRGRRSFTLAARLLSDDDPDVVLQGVLILDHIKDPRAVEPLRSVLNHADPNIVQAAIVAIGHVGDARTISDLLPFLDADTWLQVAAIQALGDLRSPRAIEALSPLLPDPSLGPMATDAMAQIGGPEAFQRLTNHWLTHDWDSDPETSLGLLAHVLEGLSEEPPPSEDLRRSLAERLRDPYRGVRESAARCLLALGRGPEDAEALSLLAGATHDPNVLPSCLARRYDLIDSLLERTGACRSWGFLLSSRFPEATAREPVERALEDDDHPTSLKPIVDALAKLRGEELARPLLNLYLALPTESRLEMMPVLEIHRPGILRELAQRPDVGAIDRIVLGSALGDEPHAVARKVVELAAPERLDAVSQLSGNAEVVRELPWKAWLSENPSSYLALASEAATVSRLEELLPLLRPHLVTDPSPELIRAVGELRDAHSVDALLEILHRPNAAHLRPIALEALGRIGGQRARSALREEALSENEMMARLAFKALATCATDEEAELFRGAATHVDWLVRLAAVEVLARFGKADDLTLLSNLAADPVPVVSQQALSALGDFKR